jgi:hypothetical protein
MMPDLEALSQLPAERDATGRLAATVLACLSQVLEETGADGLDTQQFRHAFFRLARIHAAIGEDHVATLVAKLAMRLCYSAISEAQTDPTLRFELAAILEFLGGIAERHRDFAQAEQHFREAVRINEEIHEQGRFNVGPLSNLLRLLLKLHVVTAPTRGDGSASGDLVRAHQVAGELKRLQERGARLSDETTRLLEHATASAVRAG